MGLAQYGNDLFFSFDQVQSNIFAVAPSLKDTSNLVDITLGNRSYSGVYNGISSRFVNVNFVSQINSKQFHGFGFQVYQQNLGQFIRLNSGALQYAFRTKLMRKLELTAGMSFGIKSLVIDPSDAGGGGNSIVPDASLGFGILTPKIDLFLGYKSFVKTEFLIDQYKVATTPVVNVNVFWKSRLNYLWNLKSQFLFSVDHNQNNYFQILPILEWNNRTQMGLGFRSNKGTFLQVGLIHVNWMNLDSDISATYLISPLLKIRSVPNHVLELIISIKKKR